MGEGESFNILGKRIYVYTGFGGLGFSATHPDKVCFEKERLSAIM
jgi:hypothetical protein